MGLTGNAVFAFHLGLDGILPPSLGNGIPALVTASQHSALQHHLGCHDPVLCHDQGVFCFQVCITSVSAHIVKKVLVNITTYITGTSTRYQQPS